MIVLGLLIVVGWFLVGSGCGLCHLLVCVVFFGSGLYMVVIGGCWV